MSKLPEAFCTTTSEIRSMLFEGRTEEARIRTIDLLHEGFASQPFLDLVAEMLNPAPRGRGKPSHAPRNWVEIGREYVERTGAGEKDLAVTQDLALRWGCSETTVRKAGEMYESGTDPSLTE